MDDAQLQTIWQQRQPRYRAASVAEPLAMLMKQRLSRRVKQLGQLGSIWAELVPDAIREHAALERFTSGVLTVMVDTAARRFELQTLLRGGLERAIQSRFAGSLRRIKLVPGQFYTVDQETGAKRYSFERV